MKKRIKKVNGVKLMRKYTLPTFLTGLFALLIVSICIFSIYQPIATYVIPAVAPETEPTKLCINSLDYIFYFLKQPKEEWSQIIAVVTDPSTESLLGADLIKMIFEIGLFVFIGLFAAMLVFNLILMILGLEYIFRGRINHPRAICKIGGWASFFTITYFILNTLLALGCGVLIKNQALTAEVSLWTYCYMGVAFVASIFIKVLYTWFIKDKLYVGNVKDFSYKPEEKFVAEKEVELPKTEATPEAPKTEVKPVTTIAVLPDNITSVPGHAYSLNQNLMYAVIPEGVPSLGLGAFANCGNLRMVSIPKSVKEIKANCFFNCRNLKRINYAGSKADWCEITRGSNWLTKAGTLIVLCLDGAIAVNPAK